MAAARTRSGSSLSISRYVVAAFITGFLLLGYSNYSRWQATNSLDLELESSRRSYQILLNDSANQQDSLRTQLIEKQSFLRVKDSQIEQKTAELERIRSENEEIRTSLEQQAKDLLAIKSHCEKPASVQMAQTSPIVKNSEWQTPPLRDAAAELLPLPGVLAGNAVALSREEKVYNMYGMNTTKSWLERIYDLPDEGLAPLTKAAQTWIYDHQNPKDCRGKKFALMKVLPEQRHGVGSTLHCVSAALAAAIQNDRVLAWDTRPGQLSPGAHYVDQDCTPKNGEPGTFDCILEPLTSCPLPTGLRDKDVISILMCDSLPTGDSLYHPPMSFAKTFRNHSSLPPTDNAIRYWWRTQSIAYITRLNSESLSSISTMRLRPDFLVGNTWDGRSKSRVYTPQFPMPPGSLNFHVRHGDKGIEMDLVPTENYVTLAEAFIDQNPLAFSKLGLITTEDPIAIDEMTAVSTSLDDGTTPNRFWAWVYSTIPRINSGPFQQLEQIKLPKSQLTLLWFSQLLLALECDAFVGTRGSNWNRLIDELRCTWIDKCKQPYVECGNRQDWQGYVW